MPAPSSDHELPGRLDALAFQVKTRAFQIRRMLGELGRRPPRHPCGDTLAHAPVIAEVRSKIWTQLTSEEFPLTAGKVENLRLAARAFHGVEVPAGEVFSFWRQLGRTTSRRGFTTGRELREGCLIPAIGGGICQLTGLLHQVALKAGFDIVERHAHSREVSGSFAAGLDATVFWNYVDLRFRAIFPWRLEAELDATDLIIRLRAAIPGDVRPTPLPADPARPMASGDCLTCGQTECFRHPAAISSHGPALGHSAFLLDARWPEFDRWCSGHSRPGDRWFTPIDGHRWNKRHYAWEPPPTAMVTHSTIPVLLRSLKHRSLPHQGAARQSALIAADRALAEFYASRISPECRHLVVSLNLLPHLHDLGILGGRTYDVLANRWPLQELQRRLDEAARAHPNSPTLSDFRADPALVGSETVALRGVGRCITPHREMAKTFGAKAWLLEWEGPAIDPAGPRPVTGRDGALRLFLPCSPLARKGIHELAAVLRNVPAQLWVMGNAGEGGSNDPLRGIDHRPTTLRDLPSCDALVLPAWIETQPRVALLALAMGVPVIATAACGLAPHPLLTVLDRPDPKLLEASIRRLLPQPNTQAVAIG